MTWCAVQLVKLACGNTIQTPFYLITDADTFFMRSMQALDLVAQGECKPDSGVCDLKKQVRLPLTTRTIPTVLTMIDHMFICDLTVIRDTLVIFIATSGQSSGEF